MSICEYSININNKCGNCKDFEKYDKNGIYGMCISNTSKIKSKEPRSIFSKGCAAMRRLK